VARLADLLWGYQQVNPGDPVVLAGSSMGGLIAWWYLQQLRLGRVEQLGVAGVVSISAPLRGLSFWKAYLFNLKCVGALGQTARDLTSLRQYPTLLDEYAATLADARSRGIQVVTIGNNQDGYFYPTLCGVPSPLFPWSDDRETAYVPGTEVRLDVPLPVRGGTVPDTDATPVDLDVLVRLNDPLGCASVSHSQLHRDPAWTPLVASIISRVAGGP
jgi:pimeloyl-ACP methyl ester carboxylesterase